MYAGGLYNGHNIQRVSSFKLLGIVSSGPNLYMIAVEPTKAKITWSVCYAWTAENMIMILNTPEYIVEHSNTNEKPRFGSPPQYTT